MNENSFKEVIAKRKNIDDEDYISIEKCWDEMTDVFSADINQTVAFMDECTADEFSWLSEIFDLIAKRTHSQKFILALYKTAKKYPQETERYNILDFIKSAESFV